jgi:small subunit ribosomal protein S3
MGQKVNPIGLRLGISTGWQSKWIAKFNHEDYAQKLVEDQHIRSYILKKLKDASIDKVEIIREVDRLRIIIYTAKAAVVIGQKGANIENLRQELCKKIIRTTSMNNVIISAEEVKNRYLSAALVGDSIKTAIENRANYKRAIKKSMEMAMKSGALGVRVKISGRLAGAEIARTEQFADGQIPLSTLKAKIDYAVSEALVTLGIIGIKVWLYHGDVENTKGVKDVTTR